MQPSIPPAAQEQLANQTILVLSALLFCCAPAYGIGYALARKAKVTGTRLYLFSVALGLIIGVLMMFWLGSDIGPIFAFCAMIGVFFGGRLGGHHNRRGRRRRPPGMPPRELYPVQDDNGDARRR